MSTNSRQWPAFNWQVNVLCLENIWKERFETSPSFIRGWATWRKLQWKEWNRNWDNDENKSRVIVLFSPENHFPPEPNMPVSLLGALMLLWTMAKTKTRPEGIRGESLFLHFWWVFLQLSAPRHWSNIKKCICFFRGDVHFELIKNVSPRFLL